MVGLFMIMYALAVVSTFGVKALVHADVVPAPPHLSLPGHQRGFLENRGNHEGYRSMP